MTMVLASSTTNILSTLLLLQMFFHWGLQASIPMLNCRFIAFEIMENLSKSELINDTDGSANLKNATLWRVNLYEFLRSQGELEPNDIVKDKLQKLKCCLPASQKDSELPGVYIKDLDDFQKKLRFYVFHLYNRLPVLTSRPPQSTSGSVTSNPGTEDC